MVSIFFIDLAYLYMFSQVDISILGPGVTPQMLPMIFEFQN